MKTLFLHVAIVVGCLAVVGICINGATAKQKNDRYIRIVQRSN